MYIELILNFFLRHSIASRVGNRLQAYFPLSLNMIGTT